MNLEEALEASVTEDVVTINDSTIVVNNDLRTMSIPEKVSILGVESDESVNRLKFRLPRYYCDLDLGEFNIYVNYLNGRTEDIYVVTDKKTTNEYVEFSWLVGRNASKNKGYTKFVLCLKKSGSDGTVIKEFNTTVHKLEVLEGLETEVDPSLITQNTDLNDLIDQIKIMIDLEGEKVISNLPKDYQELINEVKALKDETSQLKESIDGLKTSSANNESLITIYDILSKGTYTEDISSLMSQLDGLVHDGMYKITSDAKNATLSNKSNYVAKESKYTCTVTASLGYKISAVVVTMGGVDISSSYDKTTKTITIESVTGPINITITTIETDYTSLQYIKGDGNSWIDTGVVANVNHRYELSAKLDGDDADECFFGADQYNVGSAYNQFVMKAKTSHTKIAGTINKSGNVDVGSWNVTENNLLSNKKMYLVVKNGSQEIYLNSSYTEKQSQYTAGSASFGSQDTLPIIPLYLFHINTTTSTNSSNASGYKRSKITVFWLKIYDDTTNEMLHEFLPVAKNGKIGMLDTVTKEFHPNIGTGTFAYEEA